MPTRASVSTIGPHRRWAGICRLRLPDDAEQIAGAVGEIRLLTAGIEQVMWNVGSSATRTRLPQRLRALGLGDPEPPFEPVAAAMALEHEPPAVDGVDVRRIATLEEHLTGLEIMLASARWSDAAAASERERAAEVFERRQRQGGLHWLAYVEGTPVAFAVADRGAAGLYLGGASTLPEARGQGCYSALVRARWDEAIRLGLSGIAVQAQYGTSAPILRRLGFVEVATVHTLQ